MNEAKFTGTVVSYDYSHSIKGVKMYEGIIEVPRKSGYIDTIPFHSWKTDIKVGESYYIEGEVKTVRVADGYPKKKTYIKPRKITAIPEDTAGLNIVTLTGKIVGKNVIRQTPATKKTVIDFQLQVDSNTGVVFPSLIAWEFTAKQVEAFEENSEVRVSGLLQSRDYNKDGEVYKIHEISCCEINKI